MSREEIYAIVREKGLSDISGADAVILETDGSLTVVQQLAGPDDDALKTVAKPYPLY